LKTVVSVQKTPFSIKPRRRPKVNASVHANITGHGVVDNAVICRKLITCGYAKGWFAVFCRNDNKILTICSVVHNFCTQPIEFVDKIGGIVENQGLFCYDRFVFGVDDSILSSILSTACG
jgi:hypothetical protein